jgi:hypothetical protein
VPQAAEASPVIPAPAAPKAAAAVYAYDGEEVAREIVGVGASIKLVANRRGKEESTDINEIGVPVVVADVVALHTVPKSSYFDALHSAPTLDIPDFVREIPNIQTLEMHNLDFTKVFSAMKAQYEKVHGNGSFDKKTNEVRELYKNEYDFSSLYEGSENVYLRLWYRRDSDDTIESVHMLKFKTAEDAAWFAEAASKSGFLNKEFPHRKISIQGFDSYSRSESIQKSLIDRIGSKSGRSESHTAFNNWYLSCEPSVAEKLIRSELHSVDNPSTFVQLLDSTTKQSDNFGQTFYLSYRDNQRWASELARLKWLLEFEEWSKKHGVVGGKNDNAPSSFAARVYMSANFWFLQVFMEICGETMTVSRSDEDSIRVSFSCYRSKDMAKYSTMEIPKLLKYSEKIKQ